MIHAGREETDLFHKGSVFGRCVDALGEIKFYLHNIGGSSSADQTTTLCASLAASPHTIVVLIETWLNSNIKSAEIFEEKNWVILRCDRRDVSDNQRDGGVLIALRRHMVASQVSVNSSQNVEHGFGQRIGQS